MKTLNAIENVLIVGGVALSIENIETLLGVILLAFQIILILWKLGLRIYEHIKNGKYNDVTEDIQKGIEDVTQLQNGLKDRNGEQK